MTLPDDAAITITLPFCSPSQNELDRMHWAKRRRLRDQCCLIFRAWMRVRDLRPEDLPRVKRRVEVVRMGVRKLDYGNLVGGFKPILDAMRMEGLLVDDSPAWVEERYQQVLAKDAVPYAGMCTRITVTPLPA